MGLAERRATQEFQNTVYPGLKKQIDDAAGFEVQMDIDWESLAEPDEARRYKEDWSRIYFEPLIGAFQSLCGDELGKQAVKEYLKRIEITNSISKYDAAAFSCEGGVLKIDHRMGNADSVQLRTRVVISLIEKAL
jgi:uncharacterized protein YjaZ